jgi:hypothetical protein
MSPIVGGSISARDPSTLRVGFVDRPSCPFPTVGVARCDRSEPKVAVIPQAERSEVEGAASLTNRSCLRSSQPEWA